MHRAAVRLMRPVVRAAYRYSSSQPRAFAVLGVQQIAIGAAALEPLQKLWVQLLGVPQVGSFTSARENVSELILKAGVGTGAVEIDLMMPLDKSKRPDPSSPPLNHVGLWVDDIRAAVASLTAAGVRFAPGGIRKGASGHDVCFIHPKGSADAPLSGEGVLIELVQAPPDVIHAYKNPSK